MRGAYTEEEAASTYTRTRTRTNPGNNNSERGPIVEAPVDRLQKIRPLHDKCFF